MRPKRPKRKTRHAPWPSLPSGCYLAVLSQRIALIIEGYSRFGACVPLLFRPFHVTLSVQERGQSGLALPVACYSPVSCDLLRVGGGLNGLG